MNNQDMDLGRLDSISMFRWENDEWETTTHQISASKVGKRTRYLAYFPFRKAGKFKVHVECEGSMAVKDPVQGGSELQWKGLIAYNTGLAAWDVRGGSGTTIAEKTDSAMSLRGHPDAELNDCKFKQQGIEFDWTCSFDISVTSDNQLLGLYMPYIDTDSLYNFIVSYGGWSWKTVEFGTITIVVDELGTTGHRQDLAHNLAVERKHRTLQNLSRARFEHRRLYRPRAQEIPPAPPSSPEDLYPRSRASASSEATRQGKDVKTRFTFRS